MRPNEETKAARAGRAGSTIACVTLKSEHGRPLDANKGI